MVAVVVLNVIAMRQGPMPQLGGAEVSQAKSRRVIPAKSWLGHVVGQVQQGRPSGEAAGPRKLAPHVMKHIV